MTDNQRDPHDDHRQVDKLDEDEPEAVTADDLPDITLSGRWDTFGMGWRSPAK